MDVLETLCICFLVLFSVAGGRVLFGRNTASGSFYRFWNRMMIIADNALWRVYNLKMRRMMHIMRVDNGGYLKWRLKVTDLAYKPP